MECNPSMKEIEQQLEETLKQLHGGDEPLCPELASYYEKRGRMHMIRHPLLYSVPHFDLKNRECNLRLKMKQEMLKEAEKAEDYGQAIFLHERAYRFDAFMRYRPLMSCQQTADLLGQVWVDSENIHQYRDGWITQLRWMKSRRHRWIDEQEAFDLLPTDIEVFRGAHVAERGKTTLGFSWTTDRKIAEWFRDRFGQRSRLWTGIIEKDKVIGHVTSRGEDEIVLLPEDLFSVHHLTR